MLRARTVLFGAVLLFGMACAPLGYRRQVSVPASHARVQVWRGGNVVFWRGVKVGADSVTGIPASLPLSCDSCRRAIARTEVDSIRVGYPTLPEAIVCVAILSLIALYIANPNNP